jgi:hypothetical protein
MNEIDEVVESKTSDEIAEYRVYAREAIEQGNDIVTFSEWRELR